MTQTQNQIQIQIQTILQSMKRKVIPFLIKKSHRKNLMN
eukprot:CAMPEP_0116936828 /NCGR_PEP_ID=MMETSP0467-20121206/31127_1 /TAXON_ID=283647 /ORGANISM="Mesodinium pulex, Strain SPMC105" /LENGTH=38 /DNA_ID= /DNA_START= /DNA_END= /DNA_ORIENTATION=